MLSRLVVQLPLTSIGTVRFSRINRAAARGVAVLTCGYLLLFALSWICLLSSVPRLLITCPTGLKLYRLIRNLVALVMRRETFNLAVSLARSRRVRLRMLIRLLMSAFALSSRLKLILNRLVKLSPLEWLLILFEVMRCPRSLVEVPLALRGRHIGRLEAHSCPKGSAVEQIRI